MTKFKECANQKCTNEKTWDIHEYHRAQGIERLNICLCDSCLISFESKTNPSSLYVHYTNLEWATKKGK